MTTSKKQITARPASKHLNSKVLLDEFRKLTTRPQYTMGVRGPAEDIMEQTVIVGSIPVEETNEHRLKLAEKVLLCASQCLELELTIQRANDMLGDDKLAALGDKPKGGQYL
jgi:hypothetical protein